MLNTLANHGFLPHNGKDITEDQTVNALWTALNVNQSLGQFLFSAAITTNPTPNATTFSLDDLDRHNILEHDASLRWVYAAVPSTKSIVPLGSRTLPTGIGKLTAPVVEIFTSETITPLIRPSLMKRGHTGKRLSST